MSADLRRSMSLPHAAAIVVGTILGASIFLQPSEVTRLVPTVRGVLLVWLGAGTLTFCGALVCAELAAAFPETGGVYVFLKKIFSPVVGFLWGWAMFWVMHSGIIAALAVILGRYMAYFVPLNEAGQRAVAVAAILALSGINYLSIKPGSALQVALTTAKLAAIAVIVLLLFLYGGQAHHAVTQAGGAKHKAGLVAYASAIGAGLFAFGGWHLVTYTAGETRDPERTIPRALLLGTVVVTACYILLNAAYLYALPVAEVARSTRVAADAVERVLGAHAGGAIAAVVVLSTLGSLNGVVLAGPRVYYAMAQDGLAFRWLSAAHPRRQTPHVAIAAQALWSSILVATNTYRQLFTRVVYTEWMFFALLGAGLFVLRRRSDYRPSFMVRGHPAVPLLFIVAAAAIALNQIRAVLRTDPRGSAMGLGLILLGLPVYFVCSYQRRKKDVS